MWSRIYKSNQRRYAHCIGGLFCCDGRVPDYFFQKNITAAGFFFKKKNWSEIHSLRALFSNSCFVRRFVSVLCIRFFISTLLYDKFLFSEGF
jgi:hypothetical protein